MAPDALRQFQLTGAPNVIVSPDSQRTEQDLSPPRSTVSSAAPATTGPVSVCEIPYSDCELLGGGPVDDAIVAKG